jgi:hypothetical protein
MLGLKSLEQKLRDGNGRTAPATVIEIEKGKSLNFTNDTGPHGSGNTVETSVALSKDMYRLRVQPDGEPEFEAVVKASDRDFAPPMQLRVKAVVIVLFDPADHERVAIDVAASKARWQYREDHPSGESRVPTINVPPEVRQMMGLAPAQGAPAAPDVTEQLTRLADLRDRGVLTEQEFAAEKAKLLAAS